MSRTSYPIFSGPKWDANPETFPRWWKALSDHISQHYPLKDSRLQAGIESWDVSAMALMSFLDEIPNCGSHDWNAWQMSDLIDDTNANSANRLTPSMEAALIEIELQLGEHYTIWGGIQRTLFQSLIASVENKSVFDSIEASTDYFYFSRACKIFRDRYDLYLASGQNATLLEERYKDQLRHGLDPQHLDTVTFSKFQDLVSDIRRSVQHTPLSSNVSDRFIADTVVAKLKESKNLALATLAFSLSSDSKRHDLTHLFNRISVELPPPAVSAPLQSVVPEATAPPHDAPTAFNADGPVWTPRRGRGGFRRQAARGGGSFQASRGGRSRNSASQSSVRADSSLQGLKQSMNFQGSDEQFIKYLKNRRPYGPYGKQFKELQQDVKDLKY